MIQKDDDQVVSRLKTALGAAEPSVRLQAALTAGMHPAPEYIEVLVERCGIEPDFYVRDMLTWALTRHDPDATVGRLLVELESESPQARSQALHTLSKIGDRRTWPAITSDLLQDKNDEVARAAWRTATGLVPDGGEASLAEVLSTQFNRGDREVQLSLSRAFVALGTAASSVVERAIADRDDGVRTHAIATEHLMQDPEAEFDAAMADARRIIALLGAPVITE
ncbi:HEAT repeat domain-containing protein [Phytoactinopolyspora alkaliphila]|uniref:HEAT repeat domain-containing protein n=1 Tax=Phytoactinopolyspora alkaliphila TaxID=1783498 RepID=A0A6N9YIB8_9ACTN|nr:HEAT repeat domain-containing protein [Phytoactinopolyspora alkaliphila]NED94619.1 HEAT repeat domain-containing protein [Phytoactinopolyspora alkaliphila]